MESNETPTPAELKPPASHTVYVGHPRYGRVHQWAIDVSTDTRVQVSPSSFVRHLIDHYGEHARQNWSQTLIAAAQKSHAGQADDDTV